MKKKIQGFAVLLIAALLFSACSNRLIGLWQVENYEIISNRSESVKATNIGTVNFLKDGTGHKELSFSILGLNQQDRADFTWVLNENLLTISGDSSAFVKTWIITESKKSYQKLQSTDGAQQVQVMELKKLK